jgi:hypothetical protein
MKRENWQWGAWPCHKLTPHSGRDLTLAPAEDGPALNYFVYPYAEVDGKPYDKIEKQFSFRDLAPVESAAARLSDSLRWPATCRRRRVSNSRSTPRGV